MSFAETTIFATDALKWVLVRAPEIYTTRAFSVTLLVPTKPLRAHSAIHDLVIYVVFTVLNLHVARRLDSGGGENILTSSTSLT
ncbi:hypothetical protein Plhal304r1_c070g0159091 [Plasmopara halstedii]